MQTIYDEKSTGRHVRIYISIFLFNDALPSTGGAPGALAPLLLIATLPSSSPLFHSLYREAGAAGAGTAGTVVSFTTTTTLALCA